MNDSNIIVIGIGNEFRGDDGAGLKAARELRIIIGNSIKVLEHHREGTSLLELWNPHDTVILIDAVSSSSSAGSYFRKNLLEESLSEISFRHSSHSLGIIETIEFAKTLNKLPRQLIFYGIVGKDFSHGELLSSEVRKKLHLLVNAMHQEISEMILANAGGKNHA